MHKCYTCNFKAYRYFTKPYTDALWTEIFPQILLQVASQILRFPTKLTGEFHKYLCTFHLWKKCGRKTMLYYIDVFSKLMFTRCKCSPSVNSNTNINIVWSSDWVFILRPYLTDIGSFLLYLETDLIANSWHEKVIFRERWRCNYTPKLFIPFFLFHIITRWRADSKEDLAF